MGFEHMTNRFVGNLLANNFGKEKHMKLNLILLFVSIGNISQYRGVPYHL